MHYPLSTEGKYFQAPEPDAVNTVLQHYRSHIRYAALVNGQIDQDTEDYITQTLLTALFKFRFEE